MAAIHKKCCESLEISAERGHVECFRGHLRQCKKDKHRKRQINATYGYHCETLLHLARHNVEMIKEIMGMVDANNRRFITIRTVVKKNYPEGRATALHRLLMEGNVECFRAMLEVCKDDDERRKLLYENYQFRESILHTACFRTKNAAAMVKEVLDWERKLIMPKEEDSSPPHPSYKSSLIFARDKTGNLPSFWCLSEQAMVMDVLMDACGDDETRLKMIMMKSSDGSTVLRFINDQLASDIFEWAERFEPLYHRTMVTNSTDHTAVNTLPRSLREYLLFSKNLFVRSSIFAIKKLELFLSKCTDIREKMKWLQIAGGMGYVALFRSISKNVEVLEVILSHISKSNLCDLFCLRDKNGTPSLHHFILDIYAFKEDAAYMLDQFADRPDLLDRMTRMEDMFGRTLVHATMYHGHWGFQRCNFIATILFTTDSSGTCQSRVPRPGVDPNIGFGKGW